MTDSFKRTLNTTAGLLAAILLLAAPVLATDPGDEAANQETCTGTCNTCPGKAQAIVELAGMTRVLLKAEGLDTAEEASLIRTSLTGHSGLESAVAFAEQGWVWLAFDAELIDMVKIHSVLKGLDFEATAVEQRIDPLGECEESCDRIAIYLLLPEDKKVRAAAVEAIGGLPGLTQYSCDKAYNLLVGDIDPELTDADKLAKAIVNLGYAAGLPGEDLIQPES